MELKVKHVMTFFLCQFQTKSIISYVNLVLNDHNLSQVISNRTSINSEKHPTIAEEKESETQSKLFSTIEKKKNICVERLSMSQVEMMNSSKQDFSDLPATKEKINVFSK